MKKILLITVLVICIAMLFSCNEKTDTIISIEGKTIETTETNTITETQNWVVEYDKIIAPNGKNWILTDGAKVIGETEESIVILTYNTLELYVGNNNELIHIDTESPVINYTFAHFNKLYWFNLKKEVWVLDLQTLEYEMFCENAIAVSPYIDEAQGAIVEEERANCTEYGLPIYSPYGIK